MWPDTVKATMRTSVGVNCTNSDEVGQQSNPVIVFYTYLDIIMETNSKK